ncbi:DUF4440 domain-containing protein [Pseudomonas sichuanensis]|uniref:DUF4440 domain-containing protein n=1 Tax=Pseudomonas sichuanensis TaxID=2213015 RepID=UPI00244ACF6B|nr:DUF4440 domain-containing protein [Pseudomonas sichuanensis]MDH0731807.1 DUF4440 domain-containing protein [Pseudomonas sichuanensis]MDH1583927.1 DUF4440 domain-containing protein [Pseudomonas sichuanensis]MDH1592399.1 DUF4440 domain-containing protein [Pseudomonas sichuanensis]MDH1598150.1 DUF4440 domain-containing protein [Pseudomonas sichuanensis]
MKRLTACFTLSLLSLCAANAQAQSMQCHGASESEILKQFSHWNARLQTGDAKQVADLYSDTAVLLPTLSATPRLSRESRIDYFAHFLSERPRGTLDSHQVQLGCNEATLAGLYTFDFAATGKRVAARYTFTYRWDGQRWLITQHHSSLLPQG